MRRFALLTTVAALASAGWVPGRAHTPATASAKHWDVMQAVPADALNNRPMY